MRVRKPGQGGVSRDQFLDPLGHGRRRRNRIDANSLRSVGDGVVTLTSGLVLWRACVAGPLPVSAVYFRGLLFGPVDLGGVDPGGLLALAVFRRPLRRSVPRFDAIHADTAAELALVSSGMTSPFSRAIFSANDTCA